MRGFKRINTNKDKKKYLPYLAIIILLIFIFVSSYIGFFNLVESKNSKENKEVTVSVVKGMGVKAIADDLESKDLLKHPTVFLIYVKYRGVSSDLKAGEYSLNTNMNIPELLEILTAGKIRSAKITIPEGLRIEEAASLFDKKGIAKKDDFLDLAKENYDFPFLKDKPAGSNLEGYLFPDTYYLDANISLEKMIQLMLKNFDNKFPKEFEDEASKQGYSIHEIITLASIVEREVDKKEDREMVAGVLKNRLKLGMPLQADATNHYIINDWKRTLTQKDLDIDSPYNTRKNKGLPPGPICSPSLESIKAAIFHKENDYLYYLSKDGTTYYSYTAEEHNEKKAKYLVN